MRRNAAKVSAPEVIAEQTLTKAGSRFDVSEGGCVFSVELLEGGKVKARVTRARPWTDGIVTK